MALVGGTVTVLGDGSYSGSGLALAIFEAIDSASSDHGAQNRQSLAPMCATLGVAIVDYFVANAEVTVTIGTGDAGLQRMPASTAENTDTKAPGAAKSLSGTVG